jgi:hypothetical protein
MRFTAGYKWQVEEVPPRARSSEVVGKKNFAEHGLPSETFSKDVNERFVRSFPLVRPKQSRTLRICNSSTQSSVPHSWLHHDPGTGNYAISES